MYRRTSVALPRHTADHSNRWAQPLLRLAAHVGRFVFPAFIGLTFATAAHAQGTMDFSGATTLMNTFKVFAMYAGAVICLGGLIFAGIRMMSGRFQDAIPGLFGALFGAGVLGWGAGWIGSRRFFKMSGRLQRPRPFPMEFVGI